VTTRNLIRVIIGIEILNKAVTLLLIIAGYTTGQTGLAQALVITLIVIEVAVIVVAVSVILCVHKNTGSIETSNLKNLKG
jgi:multisubunit Na+/H+ antiporter MnhC subunit